MVAPYASLTDFKDWVGLDMSVDDIVISDGLDASTTAIGNFCNTDFHQGTAGTNLVFDTCDPYRLRITDMAAVTAVATDADSDGVYETVWAAADYQLLPLNRTNGPETLPISEILAVGAKTFPRVTRRLGLAQITGTPGWEAVPAPVFEATLMATNRLIKRRRSPEGVAGFDEFGVVRISTRDDPDIVRLLTPYRTQNRAGGWAFA